MTEHRGEHEAILGELVGGERSATDPAVAALLAGCPRCRERWHALQAVGARLEEAGALRRKDLAELRRSPAAPGEERVAPALARLAKEEPHARRRPRWPLAAAAAVLVVGAFVARALLDRGDEPAPVWLGQKKLELIAPRDEVESFERFEWKYDGEAAGFDLRIHAESADGPELLNIPRWKETTWTPDAEFLRSLPTRIYWEVDAVDEFGRAVAVDGCPASLSSR